MNKEEAIRKVKGYLTDYFPMEDYGEVEEIIKALKEELVLDKIKVEIEQSYCIAYNDYDHGRNYGLYMATQIIDEYKTENDNNEHTLEYTDQDTIMSADETMIQKIRRSEGKNEMSDVKFIVLRAENPDTLAEGSFKKNQKIYV